MVTIGSTADARPRQGNQPHSPEARMTRCDVTIVGAGPYGLAAGAHLAKIKGLEVRSFGEPMEFWKSYMPAGMFLRSPWSASTISDPSEALTIDQFNGLQKDKVPVPIPLDT